MTIYRFDTYHEVLKEKIEQNTNLRGYQLQLAKAAGMHPSYLSRILNHSTHLTPDQAAGLCEFWGLDRDSSLYFMNLVHLARAGSPHLKRLLEAELAALRQKHQELGDQLAAEKMNTQEENVYYSSWHFSAIHVLLTIPEFRTERRISEKLGLPGPLVKSTLEILASLGLAKSNRGSWEPTKKNIHLSNQSWMANVHHMNWRMKVSERAQFRNPLELHYTGLHSLSLADFKLIREKLQESLVQVDQVVRPSREEELACLTIDWVKL